MRKTTLAILALLLCAVWAVAQQSNPSSQTGQAGQSQSSGSNQTIQGCLSRAGSDFVLTADSGTKYRLSGDTSQLSDHVGHEVQIKGSTSQAEPPSAAASPSTGGSSSDQEQTLQVSSLKHISNTCSAGPSSQPK